MVDVFISYSRRDEAAVARLAEAIAREGYAIWWDQELPPHRSYGDVITDKIGAARAAIVVWSADSVQSEWVRAEADMARNQRKLIQTSLDDVMPPLPFNQIQYAEIGDWQGEADHPGWRKVKLSLAELCGPRDGDAAAPAPAARRSTPAAAPHRASPPPAPPAAPTAAQKWPLFAGLGVAALAVIGAGLFLLGGRDPATSVATDGAASQPVNGAQSAGPGAASDDTPASRFDLLATVDDPDGFTNVRDTPSREGRIVGRVDVGKAFTTFDQDDDWWQVRLPDGTRGYVARSRIRLSGETAGDIAAAEPDLAAPSDEPLAEAVADMSGMTFPDSSARLLTSAEVAGLGPSSLRVARNEIYARKGRIFRDAWLRDYFSQYGWYHPRFENVELNAIETKNVALLSQYESRYQ